MVKIAEEVEAGEAEADPLEAPTPMLETKTHQNQNGPPPDMRMGLPVVPVLITILMGALLSTAPTP